MRTGPIGRAARLAWLIAVVLTLSSLVDARGPSRFRDPHVLTEPSAWLVHFLSFVIFVILVGVVASALVGPRQARRWQAGAIVFLVVAVALAGAVGEQTAGAVWGFPLAELVWIFDIGMLGSEVVAFALAIALGTPGCEIGVWGDLIARARGEAAQRSDVLACVVGLHRIDAWEAARRRK